MLQQAALKQTGQASFIGGLSYDRTSGVSVTDQEKAILYQNALDYAKQNNLQLGVALSQAQINELSKPMLWYVEQTVPDPGCVSTGVVTCKTVTALMPQVYLPSNTSALSAGGNIIGQDVTLDFNQDGHGSILNTGNVSASNTLAVDTSVLTNRANQVDVGHIWQYIQGEGYSDTTGTQVQPGGFMSAANMDLNVQTLSQIGGALQILAQDGTIDQAGTQQFLGSLQQKLGAGLTQTTLSDALHTSFTAQGGFGPESITAMAFAVVVAVMTYGAASAVIGGTLGTTAGSTFAMASQAATAGLGNIALSAGIAGFASSAASQLTMTGTFSFANAFEAAAVAAITAGLTNGITYNSSSGLGFATSPLPLAGQTSSLAMLAGVNPAIGNTANQAMSTTATLGTRALAMLAEAGISSGVSTVIEGGSFGNAFKNALVGEVAAAVAYKIGDLANENGSLIPVNSPQYILTHAVLGCAASAAEGTGCVGGAIGGAASALVAPWTTYTASQTDAPLYVQNAIVAGLATLTGGVAAGLAGVNAQAGAAWAQNEALNNTLQHRDQVIAAIQKTLAANPTLASKYSVDTLEHAAENVYGGNGGMGVWKSEADAQAATAKNGTTYYQNAQGLYVEQWKVPPGAEDVAQNIVDNAFYEYGSSFAAVTKDNQSQLMSTYLKTFGSDPSQFQGAAELAGGGALVGIGATSSADSSLWSSTSSKTAVENAYGHWDKHIAEFPQYQNALQYVQGARNFVSDPPAGTLSIMRSNGDTVLYDPATNTLAVKGADGVPKTMFKPDPAQHGYPTNMDYFNAQKR